MRKRRLDRRMRREVRRDLIQLRRDNQSLSRSDFEELAIAEAESDYEGIDPDNLKLILDFIRELLPLILDLFT